MTYHRVLMAALKLMIAGRGGGRNRIRTVYLSDRLWPMRAVIVLRRLSTGVGKEKEWDETVTCGGLRVVID